MRQIASLIRNPGKLLDRIEATHQRERTWLSQMQKTETRVHTGKILDDYARRHNDLVSRHTNERQAERDAQFARPRTISLEHAKTSLLHERQTIEQWMTLHRPAADAASFVDPAPKQFRSAPPVHSLPPVQSQFDKAADPDGIAPLLRAEQIKRDMAEWRKRNEGNDFGREM